MATFTDWRDLPDDARKCLDLLESFIGDVDGQETDGGGTIDATDAVQAINGLVSLLRSHQ